MLGRSSYLYYATTCADDVLNGDDIPMADDDNLPPPTSVTEIIQQSKFKAKPALRRRSPPIASEDELTDSVSLYYLLISDNKICRKLANLKRNLPIETNQQKN